MSIETTTTKSGSFIVSELGYVKQSTSEHPHPSGPAITISQETGSGAHDIGELAAQMLRQGQAEADRWEVIDRQLVEKALEEHHLPARLAKRMPEDRRTYFEDVTDALFGLRPPSWELVPKVVETILRLVRAGHVIVIGRGAPVIASGMPGVFQVRLVASLSRRIERVQQIHGLTQPEASEFVEKEDRGSRRYARAHFHARIEDEMLYHLVINTDRLSYADAAALIIEGARRCFESADASPKAEKPT